MPDMTFLFDGAPLHMPESFKVWRERKPDEEGITFAFGEMKRDGLCHEWTSLFFSQKNFLRLVAVVGDQVVGMLGLHTFPDRPRRQHVGAIGMAVRDEWQGKGIGTALMSAALDLADKWLNLTRLELEVYTDNEAAIRLYERFGFEREGRLRQHAFRDGHYVDSYMMARLRPSRSDT